MTFFLTSLFPDPLYSEILQNSIGAIANANNSFQRNIYQGLKHYFPDIFLINLPNVGAYPYRYKTIQISSVKGELSEGINGISLSFLNVAGIKNFSRYYNTVSTLNTLSRGSKEEILFIYDLHLPFLMAALKYKENHSNLKICLFVPDLHGYTGEKDTLINRIRFLIEDKLLRRCIEKIDAFVFVSKYMSEKIKIGGTPSIVIEGVLPSFFLKKTPLEIVHQQQKQILYSGALNKRNGVDRLVEAFMNIKNIDYNLVVCGDGELKKLLKNSAEIDKRICYLGQVEQEKIFILQRQSTLLVNPRMPDQNFTRYSFPSKTMEYFASGRPTLMYKLDGIPDEYFDYCYLLEDLSIEALTKKIIFVCEKDVRELNSVGSRAREFILKKDSISQCRLIKDLLGSC